MIQEIKQYLKGRFYLIIYAILSNLFLSDYSYSNEKPLFSETCYIDNSYVLLYKIINWWNDSEPDYDNMICGNTLRCKISGISTIQYDSVKELLTISTNSDIEDLVSIFKECENCTGPSYFKCTYLNEKYFGKVTTEDTLAINTTINTIGIKSVALKHARQMIDIEGYIAIELEGLIGGLLLENGKITFHQNGTFLKSCSQSPNSLLKQSKTFLTIKNSSTMEILAKYTAVIE